MGLIGTNGEHGSIWTALQDFCKTKPVWGTCAGMILLADQCVGKSSVIVEGQALIGGMDVLVCRNYFGAQVASFERPIAGPPGTETSEDDYPGVFIRAPAILKVGPKVKVLGTVHATPCPPAATVLEQVESSTSLPRADSTDGARTVICAAQQDNVLCTAFHPELTNDTRWHAYFRRLVLESIKNAVQ